MPNGRAPASLACSKARATHSPAHEDSALPTAPSSIFATRRSWLMDAHHVLALTVSTVVPSRSMSSLRSSSGTAASPGQR